MVHIQNGYLHGYISSINDWSNKLVLIISKLLIFFHVYILYQKHGVQCDNNIDSQNNF